MSFPRPKKQSRRHAEREQEQREAQAHAWKARGGHSTRLQPAAAMRAASSTSTLSTWDTPASGMVTPSSMSMVSMLSR